MPRRRLDAELVRRGLIPTRAQAREAVLAGSVLVGGRPARKPATLVGPEEALVLTAPPRPFVSRGGEKLRAALERLEVDPRGRRCLDAGASTGGFTDCLLRAGAAAVIAVDVGYGQLALGLRRDPRVVVLERTNVRDLCPEDLPFRPELVVADLSFVPLRLVVPVLVELAVPGATFVVLVKPQFESERRDVGRGGVVRDPAAWRRAIEVVAHAFERAGVPPIRVVPSALPGPAGNVEFFLHAGGGGGEEGPDVAGAVREAESLR